MLQKKNGKEALSTILIISLVLASKFQTKNHTDSIKHVNRKGAIILCLQKRWFKKKATNIFLAIFSNFYPLIFTHF